MTALATETITTASGSADKPEAGEVFHVEHRCGRTGPRVQLARYTVGDGEERVLYGQRVDGVVRFLPEEPVVVDTSSGRNDDGGCSARQNLEEAQRPGAARPTRPEGDSEPAATSDAETARAGLSGARVELARYAVSAGERVIYGQRVFGVVRFLPDDLVVLVLGRAQSEESSCRSRGRESRGGRADAVRPKRPNVTDDRGGAADACVEGRS